MPNQRLLKVRPDFSKGFESLGIVNLYPRQWEQGAPRVVPPRVPVLAPKVQRQQRRREDFSSLDSQLHRRARTAAKTPITTARELISGVRMLHSLATVHHPPKSLASARGKRGKRPAG
jgi:hypothetical protein